jgi:hypothetical protein
VRRALPLLVALAGCETGFESQSIVIDLRVLGMRADPAEVVVDVDPDDLTSVEVPPVALTALVVDPEGPRPLEYSWTACPEVFSLRCDDEDITYRLPFGSGTLQPALDGEAAATLQADLALLRAALEQDEFLGLGGVPVIAELVVRAPDGDEIHAAKRVFFSPRVPPERRANQNPALAELRARGAPFPEGEPLLVAPGESVELVPVEPAGVREPYVVPTLDGGSRSFTENLRYSWLATGGSFRDEFTGGAKDIFGNEPLLRTEWRAPAEPGTFALWVVQRDERGGTFWTRRILEVR